MTTTTVETKPCANCETPRPLTAFPVRPDTGRRSGVCRRCVNDRPMHAPVQQPKPQPKPQPKARRAPDLPRPDWTWQDGAACQGEDLVLFFGPDGERQPEREAREAKAKVICRGCPVLTACLHYAIARPEKFGTWGAQNEDERVNERRRRQRRANAA